MSDTSPQPVQDKNKTVCIEHEKLKLHFAYLVVILVFSMILLATGQFTPKEKFTEYLSNAATLVSVVLGLVAIFYSFISNDGLSKSLGSINNVSEQIAKTREEISIYVDRTKETGDLAESGAKLLSSATLEIKHNLSELSSAMEAIRVQTSDFGTIISEIPSKFEKLEITFQDAAKGFGVKEKSRDEHTPSAELAPALVQQVLETSSLACNLVIIACVFAFQSKKQLDLENFSKIMETKLDDLMSGYIIALNAFGAISIRYINSRNFEIVEANKNIEKIAEKYYIEYLNSSFNDDKAEKEIWKKRLDAVKDLFFP
ncbi:hypothetical protein P9875_17775 [Janthinobacterium rivuli]|uniref:Uncharacterized protein n=1 Tax=Janthinobacterium rivuli TaxID=2751478 RepID=A0ABY8I0S5_9BURK|nr:hypothetical protein [Janthinobacterium rivuli]WFR77572.1 hypothetical protein P9875_17775 [Janthinobacterium rivuli]